MMRSPENTDIETQWCPGSSTVVIRFLVRVYRQACCGLLKPVPVRKSNLKLGTMLIEERIPRFRRDEPQ